MFIVLPDGSTLFHKCTKNFDALTYIFENAIKEGILKNPLPIIGTNIAYMKDLADSTPLD